MTITNPNLSLSYIAEGTTATITTAHIVFHSIAFKEQLLKELMSSSNSVSLQLTDDCSEIDNIIGAAGDIWAQLKDGNTILFTGYLSDNYKWTITDKGTQALNIIIEDVGTKLLGKTFLTNNVAADYILDEYINYDSSHSIVKDVCDAAGIIMASNTPQIAVKAVKSINRDTTCREILDKMLYEAGYAYYFTSEGKLNLFEINCTSTSGITTLDSSKLYVVNGEAVSLTRRVKQYKQANVNWTSLEYRSDVLVYQDVSGQSSTYPYCNITIPTGTSYPDEDGNIAKTEACDLEKGSEIVYISDVTPDVSIVSGQYTSDIHQIGSKSVGVLITNTGNSDVVVRKLQATADICAIKAENVTVAGETVSSNESNNLFSYNAEYIHDLNSAKRLANLVVNYYKYCHFAYTFNSKENLATGSLVNIVDDIYSGLNTNVLIIGKSFNDTTDIIQYLAVAISAFNLSSTVYTDSTIAAPTVIPGPPGEPGEDAKLFLLSVSPSTFISNERSAENQTIIVYTNIENYDGTPVITTNPSFTVTEVVPKKQYSFQVPKRNSYSQIIITGVLAGAPTQILTIRPDETETAWVNLGTFSSDPIDANGMITEGIYYGEYVVEGDVYLKETTTTSGGETTVTTTPMIYTDEGTFAPISVYSGSDHYNEKLLSMLPNVFASRNDDVSLVTSGDYTWITNLIAEKVTAEVISALQISLMDNGYLKSENYTTASDGNYPTLGFYLGTDGIGHFYDAYLSDIHVKCKDKLNKVLLQTQEYQSGLAAFTPYDTSVAARWCIDDLTTALTDGREGTYGGNTRYFIKPSEGSYGFRHMIMSGKYTSDTLYPDYPSQGRPTYQKFTAPYSGYYGIYIRTYGQLAWVRDDTTNSYLYRQTGDSDTENNYGEFYCPAGHTISVYAYTFTLYYYEDAEYKTSISSKTTTTYNYVVSDRRTTTATYQIYTRELAVPRGAVLSTAAVCGTFNSANYLNYRLLSSSFDSLTTGEVQCENNSYVTINGTTYSPLTSIGKSSSWISFNTASSYVRVSYPRDTSTIAMTGWFKCTAGSVDVVGQESALVTYHVEPSENGVCHLGASGKAWSEVTAYNFNTLSAKEYKEDIKPYEENATEKINDIDIVSYKYKGKEDERVGFIADDTDEIFASKGHDKFDITNTLGMILKSIQELSKRIDTLESK